MLSSGFITVTTDGWGSRRLAKDPINLVFVAGLGHLEAAVDAVKQVLGFGYTRLAGDQWFEFMIPPDSAIHRHDVSVASGRDLWQLGSRHHIRLMSTGIAIPGIGIVTAASVHRDAPTLWCGFPNEVATDFDLPRRDAEDKFRAAGFPMSRYQGLRRSFAQCDGTTVPTDGVYTLIG